MTTLTFGNVPADMGNGDLYGYGAYFSEEDLALAGYTATTITGRDPATNSLVTLYGALNIFNWEATSITRAQVQTSGSQLLLDWNNLQSTAGVIYGAVSAGGTQLSQLFRGFLTGADTVTGGTAADRLMGHEGNDSLAGGAGP